MKKGIKKMVKKLLASIIVAIIMLISSSQVLVYAVSINVGSSGITIDENSSSDSGGYVIYGSEERYNGHRGNQIRFGNELVWDYYVADDASADYYCLRGNTNVNSYYSQTYSNKISIMDSPDTVLSNINKAGMSSYISFKGNSENEKKESIKALQWLVKNMYYVSSDNDENSKKYMLDNLNTIISKFGGNYKNQKITGINEEFIGVIQQFVTWQFVNHNVSGNSYYSNGLTIDNIKTFTIRGEKIADSEEKANQAYALYTSLVNGAKTYAKDSNSYTIPTYNNDQTINVSGKDLESIGNNTYKIGPIKLDIGNISAIEKISDSIQISTGEKITSIEYYVGDKKQEVNSNNIKDLVGKEYYIKFTTEKEMNSANIDYKVYSDGLVSLKSCEGYIYITGPQNGYEKQPILGTKKSLIKKNSSDKTTFRKEKDVVIDLALTKQITKVERDGTVVYNTNRLINIDDSKLKNGTTAGYYMDKSLVTVAPGDIITYKLTAYNEGTETAYVNKITDYLPNGLEFVEIVNNNSIKWDKESAENGKVVCWVPTDTGYGLKLIGKDSSEEGQNTCELVLKVKVSDNVKPKTILRNIAEITDYGYVKNDEYIQAVNEKVDIDSIQDNLDIEEYEGRITGTISRDIDFSNINKGIISQEDDDDFEQVIVGNFDLALRKFISKVKTEDNTTDYCSDREPSLHIGSALQLTRTGTASYYHSKTPVTVKKGDIVTYTIRVYNEGYIDGYAKEITDYLPAGLEFANTEENIKYGWNAVKNSDGTTTVKTTYLQNTVIPASNGTIGYLNAVLGSNVDFYKDINIECKVADLGYSNGKILTNVAEITNYGYYKDKTYVEANKSDVDIDSQENNVFLGDVKDTSKYYEKQNVREDNNLYEGIQDDDDFENVKVEPFDLALRKFISKVNGEDLKESREPNISHTVSALIMLKTGTAGYYHDKTPIILQTGDKVIYTIRIYNEGYIDGYAKEITDYLPAGLKFVEDSEVNKNWKAILNDDGTTTVTTNSLQDNLIPASNGAIGYLRVAVGYEESFWKDVQIECEVTSVKNNEILTNVAEITKYGYNDASGNYVEANKENVDIDSEQNNVFKTIKNVTNTQEYFSYQNVYDINRKITIGTKEKPIKTQLIPGIQDDDDFENVKVEAKFKYNLILRKTDENGNEINGAYFTINSGESTLLNNEAIQGSKTIKQEDRLANTDYTYTITENESADGYVNILGKYKIQVATYIDQNAKLNLGTCQTQSHEYYKRYGFIILNEQNVIVEDTATDLYTKVNVSANNNTETPQIIITVQNGQFDLALRKFITGIRTGVGSKEEERQEITNRIPVFKVDENGNYTYEHTKEPVLLGNQNIVEYTIRVYNEGSIPGYAKQIKDDIPEGLEFLPNDELNKEYGWIMQDEEGNVTEDVNKAKYITTDYLSKEKEKSEGENLLEGFNAKDFNAGKITEPNWKEVKVAFKVTIPNSDNRIIINQAQISDDSDKDGNEITDKDSIPNEWNEGEDDQDIEKVKVLEFDLSLRKWVTKAIVIEDGKERVTETGHKAEDDPEQIVKVDLQKSKVGKVVVKFEYKIRVTNEGEIAGYAKEISDYIPEGLRFEQENNPLWSETEGKVTTDQLKDTLLQPGESAEVGIILTWISREDNMGLKVNTAEISKDYNDYGTPDKDSVPNNQVPGEDDIDDAPVMLTVKTGQAIVYIGIVTAVLGILGVGIILIKKYVL